MNVAELNSRSSLTSWGSLEHEMPHRIDPSHLESRGHTADLRIRHSLEHGYTLLENGVDQFSRKEGRYEPSIANICSSWELGPQALKRGSSLSTSIVYY